MGHSLPWRVTNSFPRQVPNFNPRQVADSFPRRITGFLPSMDIESDLLKIFQHGYSKVLPQRTVSFSHYYTIFTSYLTVFTALSCCAHRPPCQCTWGGIAAWVCALLHTHTQTHIWMDMGFRTTCKKGIIKLQMLALYHHLFKWPNIRKL